MRSCELLWEQLGNDGRRADKQVEELLQEEEEVIYDLSESVVQVTCTDSEAGNEKL